MRRFTASLVTLALLLGACVGRVQHSAKAAIAAVSNVTSCELLANENVKNSSGRSVSLSGRTANVTLVWGSEPAHAAAALLGALLRHVRLYDADGVHVPRTPHPHAMAELAANCTYEPSGLYTNLVIAVSTAWEPKLPLPWNQTLGPSPGLAGPRLEDYGVSSVPARRRLFAWLKPTARDSCRQHVRWAFYTNETALADCDFVGAANPQKNVTAVEVLGVGDCGTTLQLLHARANATKIRLYPRQVDRTDFVRTRQTANHSFLFLDYDMWEGAKGVSVVEPPPCVTADITHDFECKQELDSTIAMRVADVEILNVYAPQLFQFVYDFKPSPESLRWILERQASGVDIEEAACKWALINKTYKVSDKDRNKYDLDKYSVTIYVCSGDPNNDLYDKIIYEMGLLIKDQTSNIGYVIQIPRYYINCSDDYHMSNRLNNFINRKGFYQLVGVVSMTVEGAAAASATAIANHVPLMLADVVPEDGAGATGATWRVAGRPRHIARALHHFVLASGWTRVAVLSQPTSLATDYNAALKENADIVLGYFPISVHLRKLEAQAVLQKLQAINARIVFVNADSQTAHTILTAAVASGMGYTDGFVWIVRDWRQNNVSCATNATKHFTVSFRVREGKDIPAADGRAELHKNLNKILEDPWPPLAVSLANALLTLSIGFKDVYRRFPNRRQDLHTAQMIRSLQESLIETPVTGVSHRLHYKDHSLEETFVFVDQWCGTTFIKRLATWRVNATSGVVRGKNEERVNYLRPDDLPRDDGASGCIARSGDEFDPICRDAECACVLLLLALAPGILLLARRAMRRRIARLLQEQQIQAIARRRHVATVLAAYLVERAALELHEELGSGRFGSVRLARLHEPARASRYIAAKALHDNAAPAEESEFLREACTIASLDHAHIVRLVGVCIADGPPLVLMELAFFGDLLGYLRARRHLVEVAGLEAPAESGEAEHVSAKALTRLAREAAEALQYLSVRGVVHRDVRAANCLVDVRRSLKLADFGMARYTVAGTDGASEYSCRRRALFPVLRMAPESIAHGVFSAASDVWALGLLVLELVTLGARPYGTMSSTRVLEYVAAGGTPPVPLDATPQTRGLARLCWARAAERRPSAAEVAAYLAAWPLALRPALLSERNEPADADSGFGESPSTELLPPDSPFNSLE